jgi:hypothetical protein
VITENADVDVKVHDASEGSGIAAVREGGDYDRCEKE